MSWRDDSEQRWAGARRTAGVGFEGGEGVASDDLRAEHLPSPADDWGTIERFALLFDGYGYRGSFERLGSWSNGQTETYARSGSLADGLSIDDLRALLFFEQRRHRHFGEAPGGGARDYIDALLRTIRERISERDGTGTDGGNDA